MIMQRLLYWFRNHFIFSKTILFIWGLILSHSLVEYAVVSVMIFYLHDTYEQPNLRRDAMVVNLLDGGSSVFVVVVAHVSEAYTGCFNMIILCTSAYVMGLMLLWVSYWSYPKFDMLYVALLLITLGRAGKDPPLYSFLEFQLSEKVKQSAVYANREKEEERNDISANIWWRTAWISGAAIALFYLGDRSWLKIFKISALVMGGTYLLFYFGLIFYHYETAIGSSPLASIYRVFKAAIWKLNFKFPDSAEKYYWKDENPTNLDPRRKGTQLHLLPHVPSLFRFLDKAAIIRETSNVSTQERQENNGELCTVKEVREVKHIIPAVYLGLTFFAYSLVAACGTTFFLEQLSNLNPKIGNFTIPVAFLFILKSFVRDVVTLVFGWFGLTQQRITSLRIGAGLFCAVLCCITAWQVELHRLGLIKKEGVLQNPHKTLSLSIWVMTPQYFLLGLMEGLAQNGFQKFFYSHVPESLKNFDTSFSEMVLGFGKFLSIPCVLIFSSWFKETINTSHLDRYFLMLGILCFLFFCIYVYYSSRYNLMEDCSEDQELGKDIQTLEAIRKASQDQFDPIQLPSTI